MPFAYIEETRLRAGFFVDELCEELGVSQRSWYRWKSQNEAPRWVYRAVEILSGKLDFFGWKGWYIFDGVLYREDLNPKYYKKTPGDLAAYMFLSAQTAIQTGPRNRQIAQSVLAKSNAQNIKRPQCDGGEKVVSIEKGREIPPPHSKKVMY